MQALLDATQVEVPKSLIDLEIERLSAAARQDLEGRGVKTEGLPFPRDIFEAQALRRVTLGLILAEVVKTHGLQAKAEQVRALVESQAQSYEQPEQVVKWVYQSPDRLREAESAVVEDNIVEWALQTAKVEDKVIPFEELMGQVK
jgi:trigger factor